MVLDPVLKKSLLAAIPSLRAFAISLSGHSDRADDLVQETLLKALSHINSFQPGTNLNAWLFTILRNLSHSAHRKTKREIEDVDGIYSSKLVAYPEQFSAIDFKDFEIALRKLPEDQKEALLLVGASGFSYEEAATICDCAVGTIKSRVNRARARLQDMLAFHHHDYGPDKFTQAAALQVNSAG